ncbi:TonB-linked outer membrane protein, SusC/RagA family [Mucilaginibacter gossypiicola]|uniref:TonB-linked outer membrane protein, SusC/RagA family n=2 Tax=Mucilaginibacter gossypiicola TaxID=551995 RepID=A0A1H8NVF6_9SPHI|nr:TonB-linked outer membrane protein, SusC/RagA family [Mucilaginibacter gossypiicola]
MFSASAYAQQINLSVNKAPLKEVFKELKAQSGYNFVYAESDLKHARLVTLTITSGKFEDVLVQVFAGQSLTYTIRSKTVIVKVKPAEFMEKVKSFFRSLTGVVKDERGKPLPGVTVSVEGSANRTMTDENGRFFLKDVDKDAVISFDYIGYKSQHLHSRNLDANDIAIQLEPNINELEEVVMVGYGTSKRKDLTGAISSVNMENLKNTTLTTIDQALSGQAAGVQVVQGDGSPGGLAKIRIRGGASLIGGNDPLYVIDGVQVTIQNRYIQAAADLVNPLEKLTTDPSGSTTVGSSFTRGLNTLAGLNINDIESIDILKDASATAIYGSKAANGVVIIVTKKGLRNHRPSVEAGYYQSYSMPKTLKVLNLGQYESILKEGAVALNKLRQPYSDINADSILNVPSYFSNSTNWIGLVTRTGVGKNANASISGGGAYTRYYTSLSYDDQTGAVLGTNFRRVAGKVSLDNDITERIRLNASLNYGFTQNDISNGVYTSAILAPPNLVPFNADGSPKRFIPQILAGSVAEGVQNPFNLLQGRNHGNTDMLLGSVFLEYSILKSLRFKSTFSLNHSTYHQENYVPGTLYIATTDPHSTGGISTQGQTKETTVFYENTLTWDQKFDDNNRLTLLGGTSWQQSKTNTFSNSDLVPAANSQSAANVTLLPTQLNDRSALLSFYLRANYAFKNKYLLTITGRSDASSKFPVNNRVGYFPSAGLAWLLNEEGFLKNISWLNSLKLRVSGGVTGTQNISNNLFYTFYTAANYAGNNALIASKLGSDQTKWETTRQKDAGIDFALFNFRLSGSFGYYDKRSTDLLVALPVPTSTGFSSALQNYATINNKGLELELRGQIIKKKNFQWSAVLNISGNRSTVLNLNQALSDPLAGPLTSDKQLNSLLLGNTILTVGQPVGLLYGTKYLGVLKTTDKNPSFPYESYPYLQLGAPLYQLIETGPYAGTPEHMVIGHAEPKFFGGLTHSFTYKRLSLITLFSFSYGGDLIYLPRQNDISLADQSNHITSILDHYSASNTGSNNPGLILKGNASPLGISNFSVFNASYLKLKSLTVNYQLPQKITDKLHIHDASFFLSGNNLFIVSSYPGPDPEVSNNPYSLIGGYTDDASYPAIRQYSFGLRLKL